MADLLNPTLGINTIAGTSTADVTATVDVTLSPFQNSSTRNGAIFILEAKLFGEDGQLSGGDDLRYTFPAQTYNADQTTYTFKQTLGYATLNEDGGLFNSGDELYVNFYLRSTDFPVNLSISSPIQNGNFG
jgi:hypothetical protein